MKRLQKLLWNKYKELDDVVLLESPFAQTTRNGIGIRQVQMGLTPTKLILAGDVLDKQKSPVQLACLDPEIESLEMISVFPVEAVNISVFRRRSRNSLKAHFCNDQILYFELAGSEKKELFWKLWCEKVKFLCPEEPKTTQSETSVGSTTSASTLFNKHCVDTPQTINDNSYKMSETKEIYRIEKELNNVEETSGSLMDEQNPLILTGTVVNLKRKNTPHKRRRQKRIRTTNPSNNTSKGTIINRFGEGVPENCITKLFMTTVPSRGTVLKEDENKIIENDYPASEKVKMIRNNHLRINLKNNKHLRRYAFVPSPYFLYGMGPWKLSINQTSSAQLRKISSEIYLTRTDATFRLPISRNLLKSSLSCEVLFRTEENHRPIITNRFHRPEKQSLLFWTPDYWYRPMTKFDAYSEFRQYLNIIRVTIALIDNRTNFLIQLKRSLRIYLKISTMDFDSNIIVYQLTNLDKELFLKMNFYELERLLNDKSTKNCPNIAAIIAFSHRIHNLIASEILDADSIQHRSRIIARYINVADKLHRLRNLQSTRSVLYGLQNPSIYRLQETWSYLRKHYSTKYQRLGQLLRLHRDTRTWIYQRMLKKCVTVSPYVISIFYIIALLLGKIQEYPYVNRSNQSNESLEILTGYQSISMDLDDKAVKRLKNRLSVDIRSNITSVNVLQSDKYNEQSSEELEKYKCSAITLSVSNDSSDYGSMTKLKQSYSEKVQRLRIVKKSMKIWQKAASQYALADNSMAKEFLLKKRYREEKENFIISKKIETPPVKVIETKIK